MLTSSGAGVRLTATNGTASSSRSALLRVVNRQRLRMNQDAASPSGRPFSASSAVVDGSSSTTLQEGKQARTKRAIVAIDGPAACGKGTLSKAIASAFNLAHLDTGLLYRAVGFGAVRRGIALDAEESLVALCNSLSPDDLADPGLRGDDAAQAASRVSVIPNVRAALSEYPRRFAKDPPSGFEGAVLDGRDVGTVLCPDADVKLFLTASAEVRAQRRLQELIVRGMVKQGDTKAQDEMYAKVLQDLQDRDRRDSSRSTAPMRAADDAHILDTSGLTAAEVLDAASDIIQKACPWLRSGHQH